MELFRAAVAAQLVAALCGCHLAAPHRVDPPPEDAPDLGPADQRLDSPRDATSSDATPRDAGGPDGPALSFGAVAPVLAVNTTASEDDPTLTGDMLEIYFERKHDIWCATRSKTSDDWSTPVLVDELNSSDEDGMPEISPDGLTIFFGSRRVVPGAKGGMDIYMATRGARDETWSPPELVPELNGAGDDSCAAPADDDALAIVLDSDRPGGLGGRDLYLSTRAAADDPWAPPALLHGLNTAVNDECAWLDSSRSLLLFASYRAGICDIYVASGDSGGFSSPVLLAGVNSEHAESDPWLSPDLSTLYFVRRPSGEDADIYVARRVAFGVLSDGGE